MSNFNAIIASLPTLFTDAISATSIPNGHVLMNAPRPLLGADARHDLFLHGRFFVLLDGADSFSEVFASKNADLDAYVVLPATREQLIEMALDCCRYEAAYRAMDEESRWEALRVGLDKLQRHPYVKASEMLLTAQAKLAANLAA